jgi:hypothetical protein
MRALETYVMLVFRAIAHYLMSFCNNRFFSLFNFQLTTIITVIYYMTTIGQSSLV